MKFASKLTDFTLIMYQKRLKTVNVAKYGAKVKKVQKKYDDLSGNMDVFFCQKRKKSETWVPFLLDIAVYASGI